MRAAGGRGGGIRPRRGGGDNRLVSPVAGWTARRPQTEPKQRVGSCPMHRKKERKGKGRRGWWGKRETTVAAVLAGQPLPATGDIGERRRRRRKRGRGMQSTGRGRRKRKKITKGFGFAYST